MTEMRARQCVLHVITDLDVGGAEAMLVKLAEQIHNEIDVRVISLMSGGRFEADLKRLGIPYVCMNLRRGRLPSPRTIINLISVAREFTPTVVQGWMYHGNLAAAGICSFLPSDTRLFWNIRQTLYDFSLEKKLTRTVIKLGARLASKPEKIVYNSKLSADQHEAVGFENSKTLIIPNGFNLERFRYSEENRSAVREELGLRSSDRVVGHISRYHPMKDQKSLLHAARRVVDADKEVCFLMAGLGLDSGNSELLGWIEELSLQDNVCLLGPRKDPERVLSACDYFISPSAWGDAFPNAVGEAMATEVPCVVTDVGASAELVGEYGIVVPTGDFTAMGDALLQMLSLPAEQRLELGQMCRKRVAEEYSIGEIGRQYLALYTTASAYEPKERRHEEMLTN